MDYELGFHYWFSLWSLCLIFPSNLRHFTDYRFDAIALGNDAGALYSTAESDYTSRYERT